MGGLASIAQTQGNAALAPQILDQAEKELGPNLDLRLAASTPGSAAVVPRPRRPSPSSPGPALSFRRGSAGFLDCWPGGLSPGRASLARQSLRELLGLQPDNLQVLMGLYDLALEADDPAEAGQLVNEIRRIEGEEGIHWRYGQAVYLINLARRGDAKALETARPASEIVARRGDWWGGPLLHGEIAEVQGNLDAAVADYLRAIELGNTKPSLARRLVGLLNQRAAVRPDRPGGGDPHAIGVWRWTEPDMRPSPSNAMRKRDFDRGVALARQAFPENSTRATDHLSPGPAPLLGRPDARRRAGNCGGPWNWDRILRTPGWPLSSTWCRPSSPTRRRPPSKPPARPCRGPVGRYPGAMLALVGDAKQAEALFKQALAAQPGDPATLRLAAGFYLGQHARTQAEPLLTRLVDPSPAPPRPTWPGPTGPGSVGDRGEAGRLGGIDQALGLVEQNLKANPYDFDDRRLRAVLLALRTSRRQDAIRQLEALDKSNQLGPDERFLLANLYSAEGRQDRYRAEMLTILAGKEKNPRYLAQFIGFLIGRNELDQAGAGLPSSSLKSPTAWPHSSSRPGY